MKDTNKKHPPKVQGLTGNEVISTIYGVSLRWVTKVLRGHYEDKKDFKGELERYKNFQKAYIKRRKMELGIND